MGGEIFPLLSVGLQISDCEGSHTHAPYKGCHLIVLTAAIPENALTIACHSPNMLLDCETKIAFEVSVVQILIRKLKV